MTETLLLWHVEEGRRWVTEEESGRELPVAEIARIAGVSWGVAKRWLTGVDWHRGRHTDAFVNFLLNHDGPTVRNMAYIERQSAERAAARRLATHPSKEETVVEP